MTPACIRAMQLADAVASGLDDAQRLRLEAHLAECPDCARASAALERMSEALRGADWSLAPRQRDAAIVRALRGPRAGAEARAPSRRWVALPVAVAFAASALLVWFGAPRTPARLASSVGVLQNAGALSVVARPTPPAAETCDAPSSNETVAAGTSWELGGARIEVLESARFCWRRGATTLALGAGFVRVEVSPGSPSGFRVATARFVVEVVGTVFEVDPEGVTVTRGSVRVLAPSSGEQIASLGAGQSWSLEPRAKAPVSASSGVAERLARARRDLVAGNAGKARDTLRQLLREPLEPLQRAEAQSLLAECSLVEGRFDEAARAYGQVAGKHPSSLTGETALYAQARAELRSGRPDAARRTLATYLKRYPNGQFRKEALGHLQSLERSR